MEIVFSKSFTRDSQGVLAFYRRFFSGATKNDTMAINMLMTGKYVNYC